MTVNDLPDEVTHLVALAPHLLPTRDVWKHLDDRVKEGRDEILTLKIFKSAVVPTFLYQQQYQRVEQDQPLLECACDALHDPHVPWVPFVKP